AHTLTKRMLRAQIVRFEFRKFALPTLLVLGLFPFVLYLWLLTDLPPISAAEQRLVRPTTQILDRKGRLLYEVVDPNTGKQINLSLASVPQACIQATLATEDKRFYQHPGVDPVAILRATWQNYQADGTVVSGASTLTQQLARNLLLDPQERYEQSLRRKLREAYLAWRLELRYTKNELLALYLNQTYYGNWAFGLEAAAQVFFAKPAAQLSRAECALVAGLVQYPSGYNPLQEPQTAKERQLTVLRLMKDAHYISADEANVIAVEPLQYKSHLFNIQAPHFVLYVQDLLLQRLGADRLRDGNLQVITTLDIDLQRQAEQSVQHRLDRLNCRTPGACDATTNRHRRVDNAAAVVLDSQTGDILAMVGSPDYFDVRIAGNVNAALVLRQPGSAIKPLTYAAALDPQWSGRGGGPPLTAASIVADLPTTFYAQDAQGGSVAYVPVNYDRRYHGPVSLRAALANSYNIPAVKVLDEIGVNTLQQLAMQAGISSFNQKFGLALTLGGGEVKLLELTAAYGIFQAGNRLEPRAILMIDERPTTNDRRRMTRPEGTRGRWTIDDERGAMPSTVISPAAAYLITDILSDPVARRPAFGEHSVLDLPFSAAVKTGTTTDWRDNWTIGYSSERIVGVWVGNADNTPMLDVSGIDGAGPIWHDLMLAAHTKAPAPFARPANLEEITICTASGLLPTADCPRTRQERFISGTAPTTPDNQFQMINIDRATGLRATVDTPPTRTQSRVYWLLPPQYHDWMVGQGLAIAPPNANPLVALRNSRVSSGRATPNSQPLILSTPTSNTAYQIHPGMVGERQRIEVAGYSANGELWAELRLVKDGVVLTQAANASRLATWWVLEPGVHRFWVEGVDASGETRVRSETALVDVENFVPASDQAYSQTGQP
ncbi:MAG: transglycosylase domain-containing protein, partial [Chloroflexota bacterium]|nr:transglycosylase domain-containing protein [Chloroflexota bacterium]